MAKLKKAKHSQVSSTAITGGLPVEVEAAEVETVEVEESQDEAQDVTEPAVVDFEDLPEPEATVDLEPAIELLAPVDFVEDVASFFEEEAASQPAASLSVSSSRELPAPIPSELSPSTLIRVSAENSPFFIIAAEAEANARSSYAIQPATMDVLLLIQIAASLANLFHGCLSDAQIKRRISAAAYGNKIMHRRLTARLEEALPDGVVGHMRPRLSEELLMSCARMTNDQWTACSNFIREN